MFQNFENVSVSVPNNNNLINSTYNASLILDHLVNKGKGISVWQNLVDIFGRKDSLNVLGQGRDGLGTHLDLSFDDRLDGFRGIKEEGRGPTSMLGGNKGRGRCHGSEEDCELHDF